MSQTKILEVFVFQEQLIMLHHPWHDIPIWELNDNLEHFFHIKLLKPKLVTLLLNICFEI